LIEQEKTEADPSQPVVVNSLVKMNEEFGAFSDIASGVLAVRKCLSARSRAHG
jgi:hypothetical protein